MPLNPYFQMDFSRIGIPLAPNSNPGPLSSNPVVAVGPSSFPFNPSPVHSGPVSSNPVVAVGPSLFPFNLAPVHSGPLSSNPVASRKKRKLTATEVASLNSFNAANLANLIDEKERKKVAFRQLNPEFKSLDLIWIEPTRSTPGEWVPTYSFRGKTWREAFFENLDGLAVKNENGHIVKEPVPVRLLEEKFESRWHFPDKGERTRRLKIINEIEKKRLELGKNGYKEALAGMTTIWNRDVNGTVKESDTKVSYVYKNFINKK